MSGKAVNKTAGGHLPIRTAADFPAAAQAPDRQALAEADDSVLNHVEELKDSRGYTKEFRLPRREVDILLTGYSIALRAKVIDRWRELEVSELTCESGYVDAPYLEAP